MLLLPCAARRHQPNFLDQRFQFGRPVQCAMHSMVHQVGCILLITPFLERWGCGELRQVFDVTPTWRYCSAAFHRKPDTSVLPKALRRHLKNLPSRKYGHAIQRIIGGVQKPQKAPKISLTLLHELEQISCASNQLQCPFPMMKSNKPKCKPIGYILPDQSVLVIQQAYFGIVTSATVRLRHYFRSICGPQCINVGVRKLRIKAVDEANLPVQTRNLS